MTTRRPSTDAPRLISRYSTLSAPSTTITNFLFWSVPIARSLIEQRLLGLRLPHREPRELSRHQPAVGVVEHRAHPHRAAARFDLVVDELHAALVLDRIGVGGHLDGNAADVAGAASSASAVSARVTTSSSALKLA